MVSFIHFYRLKIKWIELSCRQETTETARSPCGAPSPLTFWPLRRRPPQFTTSSGTRRQPTSSPRSETTELFSSGCSTRRKSTSPSTSTRRTCPTTYCRNITWSVSTTAIGSFKFSLLRCRVPFHCTWSSTISHSPDLIFLPFKSFCTNTGSKKNSFNPIALLRPLPPDLYIYHPLISTRHTAPPDKSMANTNSVMPSGD